MNRSIITLKEMINICKKTQQLSASLMSQAACSAHRVLLALLLLTTGVGSAWAQDTTWDGSTKTAPDMSTNKGTSEALAIQIKTAAELAWLGDQMRLGNTATGKTYGNKYWILTADIDLGGNSTFTGKDWASMIGHTGNAFCGYFNGDSHTVSNIQVDAVTSTKYYGLFTSIQGKSTTDLSTVHDLNISGVFIKATAPCAANTRIGGLAGYVKQANISNVAVSNVNFTFTNTVTNTTQLGGAIGCMENNTTLNNVDVTGVTASFAAATTKLYLGGLVGQSGGNANTNKITNCDVKTVKVTHSSNITGETQIGGLVGQANTSLNVINNNTVAGVEGKNDGKAFDVSVSGTTVNFYAGGLLGYTTGGAHEIKNNEVSDVYISVGGNTAGGNIYLAGLVGYAKGAGSPSTRILMQGNTTEKAHVSMNGEVGHALYMGGFLGYADEHVNVYNNKVTTPNISITNNVNNETYVGGAVGRQNKNTIIDGMTISGGSISGPSSIKTIANNKVFFVGGFIGQQNSSGAAAYQPNVFKNIAVTGININLEKYQPATTITNHKFAVGGIAGCVNAPNKDVNGFCGMPENIIFKGGKIYAPYATTSPTVSNFNAQNPGQSSMTMEEVTTIDALDKAKTKTWYYSDYELGLSSAITGGSGVVIADNATTAKDKFHKNYTSSATITVRDGISYLTVNNSTFQKQNRFQDSERDSKTVLWWTSTAGYSATGASADMFTNEEQPIYPHQAGASPIPAATSFPYYWYFFQGVSNANYVASDVATKIVEGIAGNKTEAAKDHPITLTISNPNEKERGFDQRTISVVAKTTDNEGNVVDANTGITGYQWYVNGVANGTGTSINLTPHWKEGQGITVNALNGETVVATATYTLAPGVLKTKTGSSEKIRSDINGRGTKANPYIIDCENALRQWSYLSTAHTKNRWEDIAMPTDPMTNKASNLTYCHYNRAYYELGADITMGSDPFIPISHVGFGSDGTWGTYSNNFSFQGNFDGKGHKISGLKITWGAGQFKGNKTNIYHGLFGLVGHSTAIAKWGDGSTTSNTVIQNLVIENATLTHDVNNTTFSYKKSYGHITADNYNNCMVGVLAGIVAANTTVQNIEIRGSKITDEGSSDYNLATMGLFVGGAIGSVQAQYNNENIPTNTLIKNIVVGTDIDLTHAKIQDLVFAQQGAYNVGGIIGRFASTNGNLSATQAVMPKYLLYTGSIKACYTAASGKKDALISPVIAATRYSSNQSISDKNISKIWEGNNNGTEQLTVADALYYNFQISDASGTMHLVTEDYPNKVCSQGARAQDTHTDGNETAAGYLGQRYQGVNYNAIFCDAATYGDDADGGKRMAVAILNSHNDVDVFWEWSSEDATPHMTKTPTVGAYIVRNAEAADTYNVVGTATEGDKYYKWYVGGVLQDEHSSSITVPADISETNIKAEVYDDSSAGSRIATTQYLVIKGEFKVNTSISKDGDTYTVGLTRGGVDLTTNTLDGRIAVKYQWYKGNAVNVNTAELLTGKTTKTITIDKATLGEVNNLFCHVVVSTTGDPAKELFKGDISQYVREANVVYLQLNDVKASNGTTYSASAAGTNTGSNDSYGVKQVDYNANTTTYGKTPETPVKSWAEAYALLKPYTEPTSANVEDGKYKTSAGTLTDYAVTWTSATNYDFSSVPLDVYEFDVYKRDNFKRKVKPIEQCTNNWNNNVIVLMGLSKDGYFNNSETTMHTIDGKIANKPVTITGQWDGTNYYGYLSNLSGDFSINADHKFENMGIGVLDKDISATASIRYRIYAHRWNVHAGKGLLMGWAAALEWGPGVVPVNDDNKKIYKITSADVSTGTPVGKYACDIAIMGGYLNDNTSTNPEMFEYINHGRDDIGQQIKIESGFWGPVCPGNRQTDSGNTITTYYTMGGPDHPAKTTITVDIDRAWNDGNGGKRAQFNSAMSPATVDVGCLLTGNHEGTMYADVTLDIRSGNMGRIVNGIKGAQRRQIKNPESFTTGGVYRHTVKYGETWTPIAAPAPDSYFGRGILNFDPSLSENNAGAGNAGVNVVELYCGGLGRGHNDGSYHPEVRSYFYGLCEVNIKGGTFQKTIYGSGAGGTNGIGTATNHTDDDGLPYWNTTNETADANGKTPHVWYAPYDYIKKDNSYNFVKVKITGTGSDDENLEGGYVNLEKTRNIINITGGIFGSEAKPVSIYAGGNGETDAALVNPSGTKVGDVKNTFNTPNHQAGNMYGAADGLTTQINISGDAKIYGSIFGGGRGTMRYYRYFLRAADNIVAYTNDNQEYTRIWNPKKSSNGDYNTNGGADWNNIINSRKNADRYLNLGQVYGNTKVSISGNVEILGNVYGGGEGVSDITVDELFSETDSELGLTNQLTNRVDIIDYAGTATNGKRSAHVDWAKDKFVNFPGMGKIFGDASVEISGNVTIHGNVYGGGKAGAIAGTTNVDVKGNANIFGKVYGAGQGLAIDVAKDYRKVAAIVGDAKINLRENASIWQDIFGGGEKSIVTGNTHFNMEGGHVAANIYGGGEGNIKKNNDGSYYYTNDTLVVTSADISGSTHVNITGGDVVWDRTSMPSAVSSSLITHIFTKTTEGGAGNETYFTTESTTAAVQAYFENEGYTNVTVTVGVPASSTETIDGVDVTTYKYEVAYKYPSTTDTKTFTDADLAKEGKTLEEKKSELSGYEYSFKTEDTGLAKGEIVWWNPSKPSAPDTPIETVDGKKYANKLFYNDNTKRFVIEHNIFGGGYIACNVADTAYVTMTRGLGDNRLTKTLQWQNSFGEEGAAHPHFYCFGGGYGAYTTVKNTVVNVHVDQYDKTLDATVTNPDEQLAKPRRTATKEIGGTANPLEDNPIYMGIYNNEYGIANATVLGVLGGSYAGFVKENTDVTVGGETFISRVYGGGFGQLEAYNRLTDSDVIYNAGTQETPINKTRTNLGEVGGNTYVHVIGANIYGNVYGGGAGVEADTPTGGSFQDFTMGEVLGIAKVEISENANVFGKVFGGGDVANVKGTGADKERTTTNETEGSNEDDYTTSVEIFGGHVYGDVFGGGSGREASIVYAHNTDNSIAVGKVDGNAHVHIYNSIPNPEYDEEENPGVPKYFKAKTNDDEGIMWPYVYGNIYGGCAYGVVTGSTDVVIDGGMIGDNIFGGGLGHISNDLTKITSANVGGNTVVTINGGFALWNETSTENGDVKKWPKANYTARGKEIKDADALFYDYKTKRFVKDHNVYGGGNVACIVGTSGDVAKYSGSDYPKWSYPQVLKEGDYKTGNTVVMMNESHLGDPDLFMNYNEWTEAPDWSLAAKCWQATLDEQREPQFSVFGAGKGLLTETLHNSQARVEVLAVRYNIDGKLLFYQDASKSLDNVSTTSSQYGAAEHWTVGWDEAYETKLQWNAEENDGGTEKDKLANFYPEDYARPNYVDAERRLRTAAFAKQIGTAGNTVMQIIGGGYNGSVDGNSLASGESRAIIGKMYGGGYGSYEGWKLAQDLDNGTPNYANRVGTVAGQSVLNIDRGCLVRSDVFAGGAGVESLKLDAKYDVIPETAPEYKDAKYKDFIEVARVGSTHLKFGLLGASKGYEFVVPVVYGYVYGGGDVANVTGVAQSDFVRGQAMRYFFGGGNGRLMSQCNDYTKLGGVGATDVHFDVVRKDNDPEKAPDMYDKYYGSEHISYNIEPIVWHRAFAGGRNGLVRGYDSNGDGDFDDADDIKPDTNMRIDGGQFGYNIFGGGEGTIDTLIVDGVETYEVTSADIHGNTNIIVNGGNQNIDQIWDYVNYSWTKANKDDKGNSYSPQYDYKKTKFNINHNIYGGGRMACEVKGNTNIDMSKGMLNNQYFEKLGTPFLESVEWKEIYNKHASPHFCVFGGGFGKLATVAQDTHVNVNLSAGAANVVAPSNNEFNNSATHQHNDANKGYCGNTHIYNDIHNDNAYTKFPDGQSLMDVIGGGYSGEVKGTCYVTIDGNTFIRNIFGGAYYANAGASVVNVKQGNIDNIYGGGMMGDVKNTVTVNVGQEPHAADGEKNIAELTSEKAAKANHEVVILGNVYGANDVAGIVGATESENGEVVPTYKEDGEGNTTTETVDGATINLRGGHVYGSVYGGGNGDYLYMLDQNVAEVTAEEQYEIGGEKKLVYRVPIRKQDFPSLNTMSDAQKIVNLATYRPAIMKTQIDFKGNGTQVTIDGNQFDDLLRVDGNIYGGGSSATISNFTGKEADSFVKLNVGSHIRVGGVYLGSDGDALFNTSGANNFIEDFPKLNNITLAKTVDWINDPTNTSIPEKYLPVRNEDRPNVYKNVLDLYFMPVEMNMMPEVTWNGTNSSITAATDDFIYSNPGIENAEIGTFCCGGNRGNMNTTTNFHVNFPEGLTITGNIIGGCNNSNDTKTDANGNVMSHTGGFLLGTHNVETGSVKRTPQIHLTMRNKFRPTMEDASGNVTADPLKLYMYREGNNVYGGCYHSGTVRGDILIDMRSNMINGLDSIALDRGGDSRAVCNVYGAGFGSGAWVYGDTQVLLGKDVDNCSSIYNNDGTYTVEGASANYVYGGGQRGNVVGTTTVRIYNGRVAGCVVGASYAGNLYGSAQTIVGYPDTYYVCNTTGKYELTRVDQNHSDLLGDDGKPVVKRQIWHTKGDIVSEATYTELADADKHNFDEFNLTGTNRAEQPTDWSKVNIQIDQAIYGGGYALPDGSGSYTVRKYTSDRNLNSYAESVYGLPAGTTLDNDNEDGAYGGNTFVMIGDRVAQDNDDDRDHITISSSQLVELHPSASDELFGKYYKSDDGIVYINYPTTIALNSKFTNETKFYNFIGRGGLYGDGRLSLSEGYRVSDIRGYGYNGTKPSDAKLLNCLHRFDASRFTDCCVSILGDLDYTTNASGGNGAVKYAIARIGELQMVSSINDANKLNVDETSEGSVTQMDKRSRNYIGFSNVVRDLGAVWSNVPFDDTGSKHHNETGAVGSTTYKEYKQDIISDNYNSLKAELKSRTDGKNASAEFQKRNNGTAKNMLGIASGFALRVENSFAEKMVLSRDAAPEPVGVSNNFYYGPAFGVFEIKLVNTRPGEAGGYVYAQNIHKEEITDEESHTVHDFMESTGNFVFPMSDTRKVVDDCYPYAYTKNERDNVDAIESKDGHYWYVTGMNYFYYGTITGYTFDSQNSPLNFNMNSKELRINLTGAKAGQDVTLKEFRMLKNHSSGFASSCDIENKFYTNNNNDKGFYDPGWATPNPDSYYKLSLSATADGVYKEAEETGEKIVPHIPALAEYVAPAVANNSEEVGKKLDGRLQNDNPYVAIRLTDKVNNNGKVEDGLGGTTSYLKKYLDEACQAIIVLTTPAVDDNGARIYDAYEVSGDGLDDMKANVDKTNPVVYYIIDGNGDYHSLKQSEVLALETKPEAVFVAVPDRYTALGEGEFDSNATYYIIDDENGTLAPDGNKYSKVESPVEANKAYYYTKQAGGSPKTYEYTINLTIKYIQGPSYEGKATVQNCALPGEMIRLSSSTVTITSDAIDMPQNGSMWTVGPGKKEYVDDTYTWVLDVSDKTKVFTYNPKDNADAETVKASRGVLAKAYYEEDSKDLYIPAYYFMNGYVARYSYSVKGIFDDEAKKKPTMFHVTVFPEDTLLVHNYHRMDPTLGSERTHVETYIRKAAERYASDVGRRATDKNTALSYVNRPRVYIEDVEDLKAFAKYVNAAGNDYGNDLEFFLMTDLTVPDDWTAISNFKGIFHGNGHIINGLGTKSLFAANDGNIYNLGLLQGKITNEETPSLYHCCYTKSNNTVYRMDGSPVTSYTEDDWKYGKVAYDLNQYYLEERYDLREGADTHNHDGYVENIFANGDYQYARTYAQDAREEYLRTNANPHYVISDFDAIVTNPEEITYHKTTHDVDESRAYYTGDEPAVFDEYYPLFETNKQNTTASVTTGKKNDYLFFGQMLNTDTNLPATIASHLVSDMTNRVYRAFGYYQSKTDDLFHFNRQAYALQPTLTAIDFSGEHNDKYDWLQGMKAAVPSTTGETPTVGNAAIFYPQVMDMPASFVSFNRAEGVTRNLLVYTPNDKEVGGTASYVVNSALGYNESTVESKIEGHQVVLADDEWTAPLLHLVDKQDFNAPIAFEATKAWYERKPVDETGYVETPGQSWESICLPYTVQKATLSNGLQMYDAATGNKIPGLKTDITFFYGADNSSIDPNHGDEINAQTPINNNNIGHEYWLRYLNAYDASGSKATFKRPTANEFPAYVPAIVSFPGSRFYEFDMSYNNTDTRKNQTITFSAEDAGVTVTDDAVKSVSVGEGAATYTGAFLNSDNNDSEKVRCAIALKSETSGAMGDSFVKGNKIWAFRGYITTTAAGSGAKSRSVIYIANGNDTQEEPKTELKPEIPGHESEGDEADDYLIIKVKGHTVLVTSSAEHKLPLVGVNGINYGVWNIPEGTSEFTVIAPGVYLLNGQKFVIR